MMHWGIGDTHHIDSWASYASVIDILVGEALYGITEMAQHFVFDLTCDVIGEAEVTGGSRGRPTGPKSANDRAKSHFGRPLSKLI